MEDYFNQKDARFIAKSAVRALLYEVAVTPKPGLASVPVYGSAYPEASAYPADVPVRGNAPLAYSFPAGQAYLTVGQVPDDYYHAVTFDNSAPDDHTVIHGTTQYYEIVYNHRLYYVNAADVQLKHLN